MKKKIVLLSLIIIFLGLSLRIIAIPWGLTTGKYFHFVTYHPDESETLKAIATLNPYKLDFKIDNVLVARGTFQIYLTAVWLKLASLTRFIKIYPSFDYYKANPRELAKLLIAGRSLSVFFGMLTIIILIFIGKIFYGNIATGLLSAFLLAITPLHVVWSHYIGTDTIITFQTCLISLFCFYIIKSGNRKIYIALGILVGLAGATKCSILPILLLPILAHIISGNKIFDKKLLFYLLFLPVGFIIGNPYGIIQPNEYIAILKSVKATVGSNPEASYSDAFGAQPNLIFYLITTPKYTFGIPLSVLFVSGLIFSFVKSKKTDILILFWIILFYLFISLSSNWKMVRWQLPYLPFLCLLSARFIIYAYNKYSKIFVITAVTMISLWTLLYSAAYIKMMTEQDVRDESSEWIEKDIPEDKKIAAPYVEFWSPAIITQRYWYKETDPFQKGVKKYKIVKMEYNTKLLETEKPEYVVLTDYEYYPILGLKDKYPHKELLPFLQKIMRGEQYTIIKKFEKQPSLFGMQFVSGFFPHDWRYTCPTILIYKRR